MELRSKNSQVILHFASIYLIWGSTYLAIKYGIEGFPPFLLASIRFILSAMILLAISRWRREPLLSRSSILLASMSGTLLVTANAFVCFAEMELPSGLVAVFIGTMPIWMTMINWKFFSGPQPRLKQLIGIVISLGGILFLTRSQSGGMSSDQIWHWIALTTSIICWSFGTLIQRKSPDKKSNWLFTGTQLGVGGVILFIVSSIFNLHSDFQIENITTLSVYALLYLAIFGSVIAFSSYVWLNQNVETTLVSTYALVNPVVAVWLGWLLADEPITLITLISSCIVLFGLYLVLIKKSPAEPTLARTSLPTDHP